MSLARFAACSRLYLMTEPAKPLIDPGNKMVAPQYAELDTGTVILPGQGQLMIATIRQGNSTMTLLLNKQDAIGWGKAWLKEAEGMSDLQTGVVPQGPSMPLNLPNGNGQRP